MTQHHSSERLERLLATVPGWIVELDRDGRIVYLNRPFDPTDSNAADPNHMRAGTRSSESVVGSHLVEWFSAESREVAAALWQAALERKDPSTAEVRLELRPDLPLTMSAQPIIDQQRVLGVSVMLSEVRELKRLERERQALRRRIDRYQKMESLGVFAGGVAHDFNNLLVGVLGNADLLRQQAPAGSVEHELACNIEQAARRASDLCDQMLAYAGQTEIDPSEVDLSQLIDDLVPALRDRISPHATLKLRLAANLPPFRGDRAQIERVALNLITNASDALSSGSGSIRVSTLQRRLGTEQLVPARIGNYLPSGNYVVLEVEDDGEGIPHENVARIFEPFYSTRFAGRGLGLAAAHGIVKAHGGGLRVDSRAGEGTLVQVLFPLQSRLLPISGEPNRAEVAVENGTRILVADDDPVMRSYAVRSLQRAGYAVATAFDGGEALRMFSLDPNIYRALVLDLDMPKMAGDEILITIRSRSPSVPVILCSGLSPGELLDQLPKDPRLHLLQKPYRPASLVAAVDRALAETPPAPTADTGANKVRARPPK